MNIFRIVAFCLLIFSCDKENKYHGVVNLKDFSNSKQISIHSPKEYTLNIIRLEMFISGFLSEEGGTLKLRENRNSRFEEFELKGVIEKKIHTDWYQREAIIELNPNIFKKTDSLKIKYRFY